MIYEVYITEKLCRTVLIEADSKEEAIDGVREAYYGGQIALNYTDLVEVEDVDFKAVADDE